MRSGECALQDTDGIMRHYNAGVTPGPDLRLRRWLPLAASVLVAFGVWKWARTLLIPVSTARALAGGRPVGNNSDLYPRWLGTRELLLHGRNPYSPEITREIQTGFYGRPLDPEAPVDPRDQQAFAYPVYVTLLLAPTIRLPFSTVMPVFGWVLLTCTAASVLLWMQALGSRVSGLQSAAILILAVSTYPVVQGYFKQQLTLLVVFLLAAAAAAVTRGWLGWGGALLALATIKPQISCLTIALLVIWVLGDWKSRWRLLFSFAVSLGILLVAAELLLTGWIPRFLSAIHDYQNYAADVPILEVLLTSTGGKLAEVALLAATLTMCWRWRRASAGSDLFAWGIALALTVTLVVLPKVAPYNQVLLIPGFILLARPAVRRRGNVLAGAMTKAAFVCQGWQWTAALGLVLLSLVIPLEVIRPLVQLPLYTIFALPVVALFAVILRLPWKASPDRATAP